MEFLAPEMALPPQFAGFIASIFGMLLGSLLAPATAALATNTRIPLNLEKALEPRSTQSTRSHSKTE